MTTNKERKNFRGEWKQIGDEGSFEAVIATLGTVDRDNDVIASGALTQNGSVPILPAHNQGSVPLGKATIEERGDEVIAAGRFNLEVAPARDWHAAIKFDLDNPPAVQEYSWGFLPTKFRNEERDGDQVRILEEVDLMEISPVLRGASIGTRTISAKAATARHESETSEATWDGAANQRRLPSPVPIAAARRAYAWIDEEAVADGEIPKSGGRFVHHFIDADGNVGAASTRACITGIAVLNGARGGTTIPSGDRDGVWQHLAGHLRDADIEPPELRATGDEAGLKIADQVRFALWDAEAVVSRVSEMSESRAKRGKHLDNDVVKELVLLGSEIASLVELSQNITDMKPAEDAEDLNKKSRALAAYMAHRARWGH